LSQSQIDLSRPDGLFDRDCRGPGRVEGAVAQYVLNDVAIEIRLQRGFLAAEQKLVPHQPGPVRSGGLLRVCRRKIKSAQRRFKGLRVEKRH